MSNKGALLKSTSLVFSFYAVGYRLCHCQICPGYQISLTDVTNVLIVSNETSVSGDGTLFCCTSSKIFPWCSLIQSKVKLKSRDKEVLGGAKKWTYMVIPKAA